VREFTNIHVLWSVDTAITAELLITTLIFSMFKAVSTPLYIRLPETHPYYEYE